MPSSSAYSVPGLSEREMAVWAGLSKDGPLNVSEIARALSLHRPAVYGLLASLKKKGLIKELKSERRVTYQTTGVRVLESWRSTHDVSFAAMLKKFKKSELNQLSDQVKEYHGKDISNVWDEILKEVPKGTTFFRYDAYAPSVPIRTYIAKGYYDEISHKSLERFVITNKGLRTAPYKKRMECASRMLPASFDAFEQGVTQFICGDNIAFVDFTTESAYIIKNAALAAYHARLFQYLYRVLPE